MKNSRKQNHIEGRWTPASAAVSPLQVRNSPTLTDQRPESTAISRLAEAAYTSPLVQRQKALTEHIQNSPHILIQRKHLESLFGGENAGNTFDQAHPPAQFAGYRQGPVQCKKIDLSSPPGDSVLKPKTYNNWVHFNIQMSGDSRMAVAGVKLANINEKSSDVYNGLIVSVPKNIDHAESDDSGFVDKTLHGLLSTHGVKDKTKVYSTATANPNESRTQALGTWKLKQKNVDPGKLALNLFQTGRIARFIDHYENVDSAKSLKDTLTEDYGKDEEETPLGLKLKSLNSPGNAVLWFKGDPSESAAINSLQTAKTEHWLSAGGANKIISKIAMGKKFAIAGSLTSSMEAALGDNLKEENRFTQDKLTEAGYTTIGKQYGFFNQYGSQMTHFGGRSGHLEPLGAMGIKTVYFEEEGNQQAGREVKIGKDSKLEKVTITGVGGLPGVISKAITWINPATGDYYNRPGRTPSVGQKNLMDSIIRQWLNIQKRTTTTLEDRVRFYRTFIEKKVDELQKQNKDKTLKENSKKYLEALIKKGTILPLSNKAF